MSRNNEAKVMGKTIDLQGMSHHMEEIIAQARECLEVAPEVHEVRAEFMTAMAKDDIGRSYPDTLVFSYRTATDVVLDDRTLAESVPQFAKPAWVFQQACHTEIEQILFAIASTRPEYGCGNLTWVLTIGRKSVMLFEPLSSDGTIIVRPAAADSASGHEIMVSIVAAAQHCGIKAA